MARLRVTTPVAGSNDTVGAVTFANGVALVDEDQHAAELRYFAQAGYTIEPVEADEPKTSRGRRGASSEETSK